MTRAIVWGAAFGLGALALGLYAWSLANLHCCQP
jgi:hypothetical protein